MLSDIFLKPPTKTIHSITSDIVNSSDNTNLAAKITLPQEEGYVASSKTNLKENYKRHINNMQPPLLKPIQIKLLLIYGVK